MAAETKKWVAKWINPEPETEAKETVFFDENQTQGSMDMRLDNARDFRVKDRPASYFYKSFEIGEYKAAEIFITAHGIYSLYVNGVQLREFVLAPGASQYNKRLRYQKYDISAYLKKGKNEIIVAVSDGWWRGRLKNIDYDSFGNDSSLLCQIEVDGNVVVATDLSWSASQDGAVRAAGLFDGEKYDARKEKISDWHNVVYADFGYANLVYEPLPVKEKEYFKGKLLTTPNGETVLDFGVNLVGYVRIQIEAKEGDTIRLLHGETLDCNGNFTDTNFQDSSVPVPIMQEAAYTCKEGANDYRPAHTYFGFRYVKLTADCKITEDNFTAVAIYSDIEQTGFFECGNKDLNRLYENCVRSLKGNFVDIPTDCPTREKRGYSGDIQVFSRAAMYLSDCDLFLRKWLREQAATQYKDGCVKQIAPHSFGRTLTEGGAGWCDSICILPDMIYNVTADKSVFGEFYSAMKGWVDFCLNRAKSGTHEVNQDNPYQDYLADQGFLWGEWQEPNSNAADHFKRMQTDGVAEVGTAYLYRSCCVLAKAAKATNRLSDAKYYASVAENVRKAFRYSFLKNGRIMSDHMCDYIRPLAFGLLDEEESKNAAADLNALIIKNDYHLNTGFLSTPDILRVLCDYGYTETAYKLLLQTTPPSWLYAVKKGATSIWEDWECIKEDGTLKSSTLNHYAFGAVGGFLIEYVGGIKFEDGKLTVKPHISEEIGYAKTTFHSPKGKVVSNWEYRGGFVAFHIEIPKGYDAVVSLPDGTNREVSGGQFEYQMAI